MVRLPRPRLLRQNQRLRRNERFESVSLHIRWGAVLGGCWGMATYNGTTQVHSTQIVDPQLVLTIYDAKTKNSLWETIDHRRLARREKNRKKETINSAQRLVDELKARA